LFQLVIRPGFSFHDPFPASWFQLNNSNNVIWFLRPVTDILATGDTPGFLKRILGTALLATGAQSSTA
jgi:hypothetical protein